MGPVTPERTRVEKNKQVKSALVPNPSCDGGNKSPHENGEAATPFPYTGDRVRTQPLGTFCRRGDPSLCWDAWKAYKEEEGQRRSCHQPRGAKEPLVEMQSPRKSYRTLSPTESGGQDARHGISYNLMHEILHGEMKP